MHLETGRDAQATEELDEYWMGDLARTGIDRVVSGSPPEGRAAVSRADDPDRGAIPVWRHRSPGGRGEFDPSGPAQGLAHDRHLVGQNRLGRHLGPVAATAPGATRRTRRRPTIWGRIQDLRRHGPHPVSALIDHIDCCEVTRDPTADEHDPSIVGATETLAAGDEPFDPHRVHPDTL